MEKWSDAFISDDYLIKVTTDDGVLALWAFAMTNHDSLLTLGATA
jgi:hypothetical protein